MTVEEIIEVFKRENVSRYEVAFLELEWNIRDLIGESEIVFSDSNYEDGDNELTQVIHFKDHNVYLKIEGYYRSYEGYTFNDYGKEVFPREIKTFVYD